MSRSSVPSPEEMTIAQTTKFDKRMRTGSGAPSFCWHCNSQLMRAPGKGLGLYFFDLVLDRDGLQHRVHREPCLAQAIADGNKYVAQERSA